MFAVRVFENEYRIFLAAHAILRGRGTEGGGAANPIIDPIYIFEINRGVLTPVGRRRRSHTAEPPAAAVVSGRRRSIFLPQAKGHHRSQHEQRGRGG